MTSSKDPTQLRRSKRKRALNSSNKVADLFITIGLHLSPVKPDGSNMVFSPLCFRASLSLCAAGSNTPTAEQLLSYLKSDSIDDLNAFSEELFSKLSSYGGGSRYLELSLANGIWIHKGLSLKQSCGEVVDNVYKADVHQSDFTTQAREIESEVNSWAKDKTNGLIADIMPRGSVLESMKYTDCLGSADVATGH